MHKYRKKSVLIFFSLIVILIGMMSIFVYADDGVTAVYDKEKEILYISGEGILERSVILEVNETIPEGAIIKELVIGDGITEIGEYAFLGFRTIEKCVIPETLGKIDDFGFAFSTIRRLDLNKKTKMSDSSFQCAGISTLVLQEGMTELKRSMYGDADYLVTVSVPDSVTNIEIDKSEFIKDFINLLCTENSFACQYAKENGIKCCTDINVDIDSFAKEHDITGGDGFLDRNDPGRIFKGPKPSGDVVHVIIEEINDIGKCGPDAYYWVDRKKSVLNIIGTGAVNLRNDVRWESGSFRTIVIREGITLISRFAFCWDYETNVVLPKSLVAVDGFAFGENDYVSNIAFYSNLKYFQDYSFSGTDLSLPNLIANTNAIIVNGELDSYLNGSGNSKPSPTPTLLPTTIPSQNKNKKEAESFEVNKGSISAAYNKEEKSLTISGEGILERAVIQEVSKSLGDETEIEELIIGDGITEIGEYAFLGFRIVNKCVIPETLKKIDDFAFSFMTIRRLSLNSNTSMSDTAFQCCRVSTLLIGEGMTELKKFMYGDLEYLTTVVIPDSVSNIEMNGTGQANSSLRFICNKECYANKYANEKGISCCAFGDVDIDCFIREQEEIEIKKKFDSYYLTVMIDDNNSITKQFITERVRDYGRCGSDAFYWLDRDNSILTIIGTGMIERVPYERWDSQAYDKVIIKEGITRIGERAFAFDMLKEVDLPEGILIIDDRVFEGNSFIEKINFPESLKYVSDIAFAHSGINSLRDINFPFDKSFSSVLKDYPVVTMVPITPEPIRATSIPTIEPTADPELVATETPEPTENLLIGDIDSNGVVNAEDALSVLKYSARIGDVKIVLGQADMNEDGAIDSRDALIILKKAALLE